jgi:hypothetical protein
MKDFHSMHLKALDEASKAVKAAREREKSPRPPKEKSLYQALKENKAKFKHLDPVDAKRRCPHPATGFFCQLCEYDQVPKKVIEHAINYGKSPARGNEGLKTLREVYKFEKSPRN